MIRIENGESKKWVCIILEKRSYSNKHFHLVKCGHMFDIRTGGGKYGFECPECLETPILNRVSTKIR